MNEFLHKTWEYLLVAGKATLIQLFVLLGPLLFLALVMNFLARKNEELSYKTLGQKVYLYVFGWLGTSVHELGHAIFAIIFAHKISEIKLFTPGSGKSLGHVKHSYKAGNPYQTVGNFFIGIGPILLGTLILWLVTWLLFDLNVIKIADKHDININHRLFTDFGLIKELAAGIYSGILDIWQIVVANPGDYWWKVVLFAYLFYSIGSSVTLSTSDIKGAFRGFIYFVILLLIFNLATIWNDDYATRFFEKTGNYLSGFYFLILLGMALNVVFIVILFLLGLLFSLLPKGKPSGKPKK
jgi:hypothetical protein